MPLFFDNSLDTPLHFDGSTSFVGGQVSNTRANLLKQDESVELINCDLSPTGQISTRRGSVRLGAGPVGADVDTPTPIGENDYVQGLIHYETPTNSYPLAITGGTVYKFNGTAWIYATGIGFSAADNRVHVNLVQGVNKLYISDGVGTGIAWWDGTTGGGYSGSTNSDPPPNPYILCWHASRLVAVGSGDPDAIYFSQFLDGSVWNRAKWSLKPGNTTGGTTGGFPTGTADPITGLFSWLDFNLVVFKRKSVWVVNCNPTLQAEDPNDTIQGFVIKPVSMAIGCIAPRSAAQCGSDVWFLSTSGVRSVARTLATETQTEMSDALSAPVQDIIDRINIDQMSKAVGMFWNNKYFLSIPLDGATENNYTLVYNFLTGSWIGLWTGWAVTNYSRRTRTGGTTHMMFGQSDGTVFEWLDDVQVTAEDDTTFQDEGVDIPTSILTRAMTGNEPISPKTGLNCEFEFNKSAATATINVILDDGGLQNVVTLDTSSGAGPVLPMFLPFVLGSQGIIRRAYDLMAYGPWRELQFQVTSARQKLVVRSIALSAYTETMILQSA